jgi:hypothetical protein
MEPTYPNVQRHWVLNRIQPTSRVLPITKLLKSYGENFTVIGFDAHVYAHLPLNYAYASTDPNNVDDRALWHDRLLYAFNSNGVRNYQLDFGNYWASTLVKSHGWVLPWTFDMILSPEIHEAVLKGILSQTKVKATSKGDLDNSCFAIPVESRNSDPLHPDYALVIPSHATFRWDESLRFLQHERAWVQTVDDVLEESNGDKSNWKDWEIELSKQQEARQGVSKAAKILSIPVQVSRWQVNKTLTTDTLEKMMMESIHALDIQIVKDVWKYDPSNVRYLILDADTLRYERRLWQSSRLNSPIEWLDGLQLALKDVIQVLQNVSETSWDNRAGRWHVSSKDRIYQSALDKDSWHSLTRNVTCWALTSYWTGQDDFGRYAVKQLKTWFWDEKSSLLPQLNIPHPKEGTDLYTIDPDDLWDMFDIIYFLDASNLLVDGDFLKQRQATLFQQWWVEFNTWLKGTLPPSNELGPIHDAIIVAVANHVGDIETAYHTMAQAPLRLVHLSDLIHSASNQCDDRIYRQILAWHILARQSQAMGMHLWTVKAWWKMNTWRVPDDPRYGVDWPATSALCELTREVAETCVETAPMYWWPLWDGYKRFCDDTFGLVEDVFPHLRYEMPSLFESTLGIPPFWNLGYRKS